LKINFNLIFIALIPIFIFNACGVVGTDEDTTTNTNATLSLNVEAANFLENNSISPKIQLKKFSKSSLKSTIGNFPEFNSSSIISGAPEDIKLYIKSIKLSNSGDSQFDETIFSNTNGKAITVHSGTVDISSLFDANVVPEACTLLNGERFVYENSNVIAFNENTGTVTLKAYSEDANGNVTINNVVATIDCPHSNSAELQISAKSYSNIKIEYLKKAKIKGCLTGSFTDIGTKTGIAGTHTYCTQYGKNSFENDDTQNIDFEKSISEVMEVDLKILEGRGIDKTESFTISYPIPGGISLTAGSTTSLTILFDLNRMLRYFNNGRTDNQAPNPSAPNTFTYFYTLDLERDNVAYAFVGKAGSIFGYRSVLEGCTDLPMPTDRVCLNVNNTVGLWMTSVYDKDNNHIKTSFMPDDDNAFTTIKGSTDDITNPIVDLGGERVNIKYQLDSSTQGTIFNFKHSTNLDDKVDGVTFEGFQETYGQLYMQRKL